MALPKLVHTLDWNEIWAAFIAVGKDKEMILNLIKKGLADSVVADYTSSDTMAAALKAFKANVIYDKRCRFKATVAGTTGDVRALAAEQLELVEWLNIQLYGATQHRGAAVKYASTVKLEKAKWQYTAAELEAMDCDDEAFWRSIYNNIASVISKYPERAVEYFENGIMDAYDAKDMALKRANDAKKHFASNASLEDKIKAGTPVVITPEVIKELAKLYPDAFCSTASSEE